MANPGNARRQRDIALAAGVSQSAVSRVFGGGRVAAATKERIMAAAYELGYQPDAIARSLVTGQTTIIAVVIGDIHNPFYPFVLDKFSTAFSAAGKQILLFTVPRGGHVDDVLPQALSYRVSGVVVASAELSSTAARTCAEQNVPLVLFNRHVSGSGAARVSCHNRAGGRIAADHLLDQGRRGFAYVGGLADTSTNRDRRRGFLERLTPLGRHLEISIDGEYSYEWGYDAASTVIEHPAVDAVFCANDIIAMGLMDALRHAGKRIPDDIAIVGFDDIPAAAWPAYSLTTVAQPVDAMVQSTLDILNTADNEDIGTLRRVIAGELVTRQSSATTTESIGAHRHAPTRNTP